MSPNGNKSYRHIATNRIHRIDNREAIAMKPIVEAKRCRWRGEASEQMKQAQTSKRNVANGESQGNKRSQSQAVGISKWTRLVAMWR